MRLKPTNGIRVSAIRLHYLAEVSAAGSMRAASDKLGVAPSSVSRQVAQLEEELGIPLIEKGLRELTLTEAGQIAIRYFHHHVSEEESFLSELEDLRGLRKGVVSLAMGEGFLGEELNSVLLTFSNQYPDMQVNIRVGSTNDVMRLVADNEVHLGLVLDAPVDPVIRVRKSLPQPICAIVAPDHRLARESATTLADLLAHRLALVQRDFRIRELIAQAEHEEGVFLTANLISNSLLILKNFARFGGGVTLLPNLAVMAELQAQTLCSIPVRNRILLATRVQIVLRVRRQLPTGALRLLHLLEGYLQG